MLPRKGVITMLEKILDWTVAALLIVGLLGITATILWHLVIGGTVAKQLLGV